MSGASLAALASFAGQAQGVFPLAWESRMLLAWCSAALTGALLVVTRRLGAARAMGLALMTVPLWLAFWGFLNSIPALQDTTTVLRPVPPRGLSRMYYRSILLDVGYLGAGFLLLAYGGRLRQAVQEGLQGLAVRMRDHGVPTGGRSEAASAWIGYVTFPLLLLGTWSAYLAMQQVPQLLSGDESQVWRNMSPYHVLMISAAAAVTEELVYRAFLLVVLARLLAPAGRAAMPLAVLGQAVLFGLAHGGYGTWIHVAMPLLFGLVAGIAAWRFGLWSAVVLHFQVDLYVFGAELDPGAYPWARPVLFGLLALNVLAMLLAAWAWRRRHRRTDSGPVAS